MTLLLSANLYSQDKVLSFKQPDINSDRKISEGLVITDSTFILGTLNNSTFISPSTSSTTAEGSKYINEGTRFFVSGAIRGYYNELYKIRYKEDEFYVDKSDLDFADGKDYYEALLNLDSISSELLERNAKVGGLQQYSRCLEKFISYAKRCKNYGIGVYDYSVYDESEYTDGTSAKITFLNPTNKTIKYVWVTFVGYNAVDDPVRAKNGSNRITLKCIGPIAPDESGQYSFEYVWFTDIVEYAKIANIKVQYKDGTFKNVATPSKTILKNDLYNFLGLDE